MQLTNHVKLRPLSLACALALAGCSSHYMPRSDGRIHVVRVRGSIAYQRDGTLYDRGLWGGGLVDAVRGVPAAERAARTHYSRRRNGMLLLVTGLACVIGSTYYWDEHPDDDDAIAISTTIGCTAVWATGLGLLWSGAPYEQDAINIYNDAH